MPLDNISTNALFSFLKMWLKLNTTCPYLHLRTPSYASFKNNEMHIPFDKIGSDTFLAENMTEDECNVAIWYEYSCLQTPSHDSLITMRWKCPLIKFWSMYNIHRKCGWSWMDCHAYGFSHVICWLMMRWRSPLIIFLPMLNFHGKHN
jgi:hypothetical protein